MTATAPAGVPIPTASSGPNGSDGKLFALMMIGYPFAWALGFGAVIFVAVAVVMIWWLGRNRPLQVPRGALLYAVFLVMVIVSGLQVSSAGKMALFVMRSSWYVAGFVTLLYLARQEGPAARKRIIRSLVMLWFLVVIGGYGALVVPELMWNSPLASVLPDPIANDEFVSDLINPRVAEIQVFRWQGVTLYRPAAPFAYTNAWGSSFALLFPFVLAAFQDRRIGIPRWLLIAMIGAGLVPFYFALNRGAWLTLGLGLVFGVVRWSLVSRTSLPVKGLVGLAAVALPLVAVTGVMNTAIEQLETRSEDSNETRATIYAETFEASLKSPLIGYGTPRTNPADPSGPPLGTHGQLWAVLYAHGFLAAAAYALFFVRGFVLSRGVGAVPHWAKVCLFIGLLQLPIYGHIPLQLFVLIAATIIASWPDWGANDDALAA